MFPDGAIQWSNKPAQSDWSNASSKNIQQEQAANKNWLTDVSSQFSSQFSRGHLGSLHSPAGPGRKYFAVFGLNEPGSCFGVKM